MSRLYYDSPNPNKIREEGPVNDTPTNNTKEYLTKVAALVPTEIIAGCLFLQAIANTINDDPMQHTFLIWGTVVLGLIGTPLYLNKVADTGRPKTTHIILSSIAFLVWIYVTSGADLQKSVTDIKYHPATASFILVAFSLISGAVPLEKKSS